MPVAVGMYLPFGLSTPILVGGLMAYLIQKQNKTVMNSDDSIQNGILVSSGLIAGESLMGIVLAFIAGFGVSSFSLPLNEGILNFITIIVALVFLFWFFKTSKPYANVAKKANQVFLKVVLKLCKIMTR